jgi:DNA gyrase subunit A
MAREQLIATLSLTEEQAQAILDMRLQRLTALERDRILQELAEIQQRIIELEGILADELKVRAIIGGAAED